MSAQNQVQLPRPLDGSRPLNVPCTEQSGLALCLTHHYTFDKGVWTLDQNLAITLSPNIILDKKSDIFFSAFIGHSITDAILDDKFLPDQKFLKWHGENIFKN